MERNSPVEKTLLLFPLQSIAKFENICHLHRIKEKTYEHLSIHGNEKNDIAQASIHLKIISLPQWE